MEYLDSPLLKIFHGKVGMIFDDPAAPPVAPTMTHFFYMDEKDPTKVIRWVGAVGPTGFYARAGWVWLEFAPRTPDPQSLLTMAR